MPLHLPFSVLHSTTLSLPALLSIARDTIRLLITCTTLLPRPWTPVLHVPPTEPTPTRENLPDQPRLLDRLNAAAAPPSPPLSPTHQT